MVTVITAYLSYIIKPVATKRVADTCAFAKSDVNFTAQSFSPLRTSLFVVESARGSHG